MTDSPSGPASAFQLEEAGRRYGEIEALRATDLHIASGERIALVGPSGSGKSTLLSLLNGSIVASSGTVRALGQPLDSLAPRALRKLRANIATIPQDLGLVPNLRVWQNVATGRIGQRGLFGALRDLFALPKAALSEIHAALERVGIEEKLYARTAQLSGGQQQRVAVARALFQNPQALLADEPVSSVDPARAASLVELLNDLAEERKLTLVMSLHNLDLARAHFPRLIGLRDGRIQFDQDPATLDEASFEALYDLNSDEMLNDG